ncbi:MAG TPA: ABC transporter substrate-binding protein [Thermoplasmata archaeon]|nr:ABC transporter substrate-binding protein [Thermoplasmata archaeon]
MELISPPRAPRTVSLALLLTVLLVVAGVSVGVTAAYFELRPAPSAQGPGTVTVVDDLGRTVTVPTDPDRVIVLSPNILDMMVSLGLRSHVVGVDCSTPGGLSADYSSDQVGAWNLTDSMCVTVSPSFDAEGLLKDSPGLVLASTIISLADIEELSTTDRLPVAVLAPPDLGGIVLDVQLLAKVFGLPPTNGTLVDLTTSMQSELDRAAGVDANLSNEGATLPSVFLTYYADPSGGPLPGYFGFGPGTFGQSLVELAGGSSISANSTTAYPLLTGPQILFDNPSRIIYGTGFDLDLSTYEAGPDWSQFPAVQDGNASAIDSNLLTEADPTMILVGLPALLGILHPGT